MRTLFLLMAVLLAPGVVCGQGAWPETEAGHDRASATAREEMESFEERLEQAVSRVSTPHAGILLGRASGSRGYRLPGYGIVFVLTPRALPGERAVFVVRHGPGPAGTGVRVERRVSRGGEPPRELERVEELERRVLILQHTAEAHRRAAEEDMDRMVRDIRVRLDVQAPDEGATVEEDHDATTVPAAPRDPTLVSEEAGAPPWKFWFEAETGEEERTPDRVVAEVKMAVLAALDSQGEAVAGLAPDDFVTVAIDFVPGGFFTSHQRPTRTLIVRARQRDLAARARGAIPPEELRSRVEVIEY